MSIDGVRCLLRGSIWCVGREVCVGCVVLCVVCAVIIVVWCCVLLLRVVVLVSCAMCVVV